MIRVLVADDQDLVRLGLCALLDNEPDMEVAADAADGWDAVVQARSARPDVVLMDVRMPGVAWPSPRFADGSRGHPSLRGDHDAAPGGSGLPTGGG